MRAWAALALLSSLATAGERLDLVVIMDGGRESDHYYRAAAAHHRAADRMVVRGPRTLSELRDALADAAERAGLPLGEVSIVVHGSEWTGLAVALDASGQDARPDVVADAIAAGRFAPLPDAVLDSSSVLRFESCGLGRRPRFLADLGRLLGGSDDERPIVEGSREYVVFRDDGFAPTREERRYHSVVVRDAVASDVRALADAFSVRHSQAVDWVSRLEGAHPGVTRRSVPIVFRVAVPEPEELARAGSPTNWVALQPSLAARLASVGLVPKQLTWQKEGREVVGRATLVTLIEPSTPVLAAND